MHIHSHTPSFFCFTFLTSETNNTIFFTDSFLFFCEFLVANDSTASLLDTPFEAWVETGAWLALALLTLSQPPQAPFPYFLLFDRDKKAVSLSLSFEEWEQFDRHWYSWTEIVFTSRSFIASPLLLLLQLHFIFAKSHLPSLDSISVLSKRLSHISAKVFFIFFYVYHSYYFLISSLEILYHFLYRNSF